MQKKKERKKRIKNAKRDKRKQKYAEIIFHKDSCVILTFFLLFPLASLFFTGLKPPISYFSSFTLVAL